MLTTAILLLSPRCPTCTDPVSDLQRFHRSVFQGGCMTTSREEFACWRVYAKQFRFQQLDCSEKDHTRVARELSSYVESSP